MKNWIFMLSLSLSLCGCRAVYLTDEDKQVVDFKKITAEKNLIAVVFLAADCPISQKYVRTLNDLSQRFPEVSFVAAFTRWDDAEAIQRFRSEFQPRFPLWRDSDMRLVRRLGATITPEVFFLKGNKVIYQGAIDNWFVALGRYRPSPTEHFLQDAILAILHGRTVEMSRTTAVGCGIEQ